MENVLEAYQQPYDTAEPLVCCDKRSVQLIGEVNPPLAPQPANAEHAGTPERFDYEYDYDYEYERKGTANLFMFTEPLAGWRHVSVTERRTRRDFAEQLRWLVDERYPEARKIKLVCDNLNTHNGASLYETYDPAKARRILTKIEFIYTPKHGSWLNIAECELSVLSRQCLNRRLESIDVVRHEVAAWEDDRNAAQTGVD